MENGGRLLDSSHYLPGVRQIVTRKLNIRSFKDLKDCEKELENPDARRSLTALYKISVTYTHIPWQPLTEDHQENRNRTRKGGFAFSVNLSEDEVSDYL